MLTLDDLFVLGRVVFANQLSQLHDAIGSEPNPPAEEVDLTLCGFVHLDVEQGCNFKFDFVLYIVLEILDFIGEGGFVLGNVGQLDAVVEFVLLEETLHFVEELVFGDHHHE
jgi:hypothetical protein